MLLGIFFRCIILLLSWEDLPSSSACLLNAEGWNPAVLSPGISDAVAQSGLFHKWDLFAQDVWYMQVLRV